MQSNLDFLSIFQNLSEISDIVDITAVMSTI